MVRAAGVDQRGTELTFDTQTVVRVVDRLQRLRKRPALFNDRMPPSRIAVRYETVMRWLDPSACAVVSDCLLRREVPMPGKGKWQRWGND